MQYVSKNKNLEMSIGTCSMGRIRPYGHIWLKNQGVCRFWGVGGWGFWTDLSWASKSVLFTSLGQDLQSYSCRLQIHWVRPVPVEFPRGCSTVHLNRPEPPFNKTNDGSQHFWNKQIVSFPFQAHKSHKKNISGILVGNPLFLPATFLECVWDCFLFLVVTYWISPPPP